MTEYLEYVQALANLNSQFVTPGVMPAPAVFNALAWGLVEEIGEYKKAKDDQKIKEAGDVLAYTTLLLLCVESVPGVAEVLSHWCVGGFSHTDYFSNLKRVNRENATFVWTEVLRGWSDIYSNACVFHSLTFAEIAQTNIAKLKDRAERQVMFSGSGDAR